MNVWYNFAPMNEAQKYLLQDLSVAIVDDHALILEGFKSLMQAHPINSGERKKKNLIFASWKIQC